MLALMIAIAQDAKIGPYIAEKDTKHLDPRTRPFVEIPMFKDMRCVSVNEYRSVDQKTKKSVVNRVYRFTYRAIFAKEAKRWQTEEFKKSEGWKVTSEIKDGFIIERDIKNPKITTQALLLWPGKIIFDVNTHAHVKGIKDPAWVWVSYNEILKSNKW